MKAARESWFEQVADLQVNQLVFLDEFGASTTMQRTHGRAAPGERLGHVESVAISRTRHENKRGRRTSQNVLAPLTCCTHNDVTSVSRGTRRLPTPAASA